MNGPHEEMSFTMTEPAEHGAATRYAFWMETEDTRLFRFVRALLCVASVKMVSSSRALIRIKDSFDADEAWHYIRSETYEESQYVHLDKIWEDAMWL